MREIVTKYLHKYTFSHNPIWLQAHAWLSLAMTAFPAGTTLFTADFTTTSGLSHVVLQSHIFRYLLHSLFTSGDYTVYVFAGQGHNHKNITAYQQTG